jgi:hypothetical protein
MSSRSLTEDESQLPPVSQVVKAIHLSQQYAATPAAALYFQISARPLACVTRLASTPDVCSPRCTKAPFDLMQMVSVDRQLYHYVTGQLTTITQCASQITHVYCKPHCAACHTCESGIQMSLLGGPVQPFWPLKGSALTKQLKGATPLEPAGAQ